MVVLDELAGALDDALSRIGDRWSLLIVLALAEGSKRFNDLQGEVTGIAPNVLSQRLKTLESLGVVVASRYSERPPRYAYGLTAAGAELSSAIRLLAAWGADRSGRQEVAPRHGACGTRLEARWYCPTCDRVVDEDQESDEEGAGEVTLL